MRMRSTTPTTAPTSTSTSTPTSTSTSTLAGSASSSLLPTPLPRLTRIDVVHLAPHAALAGVVSAHVVAEVDTGVKGASGICHLPGGEVLVVDDDHGIAQMLKDSRARKLVKSAKDVEGLCASPDGRHVWVVHEGTRRVERYDVDHSGGQLRLTSAGDAKKLPKLKGAVDNKGWEGLAFLPATSGLGGSLACVHERSPRRIGLFALPDLDTGFMLKLPKDARELLPDLADIAVDDRGHLFVLSDEGRCVVEFALMTSSPAAPGALLAEPSLVTVSSFALPVKKDSKPEGLAFDAAGRLWVCLDTNGKAVVLELER